MPTLTESSAARRWLSRISSTSIAAVTLAVGLALPAQGLIAESRGERCTPDDPLGQARVKPGYQGADPDSLTAAEAAAGQQATTGRLQRLGYDARSAAQRAPIRIAVRWNVIMSRTGEGSVTNQQIARQLRVMNRAFAGETSAAAASTPFVFYTEAIRRVRNTDWNSWDFQDDDFEAKRALAVKPRQKLNVYLASLEAGLLGYAFYPFDTSVRPVRQGVVALNESLPGGSAAPFNQGDTVTHEVGHWLGLAHTFENGCDNPGDYVGDTPYQFAGANVFSCRESLDTCDRPGRDPVHNFMSYADDFCLDRFTPGQSKRMVAMWTAWRSPVTTP